MLEKKTIDANMMLLSKYKILTKLFISRLLLSASFIKFLLCLNLTQLYHSYG